MTQQEESVNFFRLVRLLIDEGSDVLRDVLLKTIETDLKSFLQNNMTVINNPEKRKHLFQEQYNLLTKEPVVKPEELDITLLCFLFRNLCNVTPTNGWNKAPGPTDLGLGDDIYRLKNIRNTIYAHTTTTRVPAADFKTLWAELKELIIRLSKHGSKRHISVRITAIRFEDLDPKRQTQKSAEILIKWKTMDDEKWNIIEKHLENHDNQMAQQEELFVNQGERLNKQEKQLKKQDEQFKATRKELRKEMETHERQLIKLEENHREHVRKQVFVLYYSPISVIGFCSSIYNFL